MRALWRPLVLLVPTLVLSLVATASPPPDSFPSYDPHGGEALDVPVIVYRRDEHGHSHGHHAQPLLELNETEVTLYHQPTPPSYWSIDFEDRTSGEPRYPGFMGLHILFMSLAFFGALPIGASYASNSCKRGLRSLNRHCSSLD